MTCPENKRWRLEVRTSEMKIMINLLLIKTFHLDVLIMEPWCPNPVFPSTGLQVLRTVIKTKMSKQTKFPNMRSNGPQSSNSHRKEVEKEVVGLTPVDGLVWPNSAVLETSGDWHCVARDLHGGAASSGGSCLMNHHHGQEQTKHLHC